MPLRSRGDGASVAGRMLVGRARARRSASSHAPLSARDALDVPCGGRAGSRWTQDDWQEQREREYGYGSCDGAREAASSAVSACASCQCGHGPRSSASFVRDRFQSLRSLLDPLAESPDSTETSMAAGRRAQRARRKGVVSRGMVAATAGERRRRFANHPPNIIRANLPRAAAPAERHAA